MKNKSTKIKSMVQICVLKPAKLYLLILLVNLGLILSAQVLNFSVSETGVTPDGIIHIMNNSTNIPANCNFKWEIENGAVLTNDSNKVITNTIYNNSLSFTIKIPSFIEIDPQANFKIILKTEDLNGNITTTTPYIVELPYISSFGNIIPPGSCPTFLNNTCTDNFICNGNMKYLDACITNSVQARKAIGWIDYTTNLSVTAYANISKCAELYTANNCQNITNTNYKTGWDTEILPDGTQVSGAPFITNGNNYFGFQNPPSSSSDDNYLGICTHDNQSWPATAEGVITSVNYQLIANQTYQISFKASLADKAYYCTKLMAGIYYSDNPNLNNFSSTYFAKREESIPTNTIAQNYITNRLGWDTWEGEYTPTTNKPNAYLYISKPKNQTSQFINVDPQYASTSFNAAYYYIDDVNLIPKPASISGPFIYNICTIPDVPNSTYNLVVNNPNSVKEYTWIRGGQTTVTTQPIFTFTPTSNEIITLYLSNYHDCISGPYFLTINLNSPIFDQTIELPVINEFVPNLQFPNLYQYSVSNPDPNYEYVWQIVSSPGNLTSSPFGSSISVDWVNAIYEPCIIGQIRLKVTDKTTCKFNLLDVFSYKNCNLSDLGIVNIDYKVYNNETLTINSFNKYNTYYLQGNILIDGNVTINSKTIYMATNSNIHLKPGSCLTIDNSIITTYCEMMWDGIFVSDLSSKIIIKNNSTIANSINGISITNAARFNIYGSNFNKNYISVQIKNYCKQTASSPDLAPYDDGYIYNCKFNYDNNILVGNYNNGNYLLDYCPMQGTPYFTGILVENVENLIIGNANQSPNIFNKMAHGIVVKKSTIKVENNLFYNIKNINSNRSDGAIYITETNKVMLNRPVTVGNLANTNAKNEFFKCNVGVYSNENNINISKNFFTSCTRGVLINSYYGSNNNESKVLNNTFYDGIYGVIVAPPTPTTNLIFVNSNSYTETGNTNGSQSLLVGINLTNVSTSYKFTSKVKDNVIKIKGYPSSSRIGIKISNCNSLGIVNNTVLSENPMNTVNNYLDYIGLSISNSQGAQVYNNTFSNFGTGIKTFGNLMNTSFYCNGLNYDYYGIWLDPSTTLNHQGIPSSSSQTGWVTHNRYYFPTNNSVALPGSNFLNGGLSNPSAINWYYLSGSSQDFIPNSVSKVSVVGITNAGHSCGDGSAYIIPPIISEDDLSPEDRDYLYNNMMEGIEYTNFMESYQAYDQERLYNMLVDNPDILTLGCEEDQEYMAFYNLMKNRNIGKFKDVFSYIERNEFDSALILNSSIVSELALYDYMKTAISIYLNSWCAGRFELTSEEIEILTDIALMYPESAGDGVYIARILLDIDPTQYGTNYRLNNKSSDQISFTLYPNPTDEKIAILVQNSHEVISGRFTIYDLNGRKVYSSYFNSKELKYIDLKFLQNGIYLYEINSDGGKIQRGKLTKL